MPPDAGMLGSTNQLARAGFLSAKVEVDYPRLKGFLNLQTYQKTDSIKMNLENYASL